MPDNPCRTTFETEADAEVVCHYCGKEITFIQRLLMYLSICPWCKESAHFHKKCADNVYAFPRCHGANVGSSTGHVYNVHNGMKDCCICDTKVENWQITECSR